MVLRANGLTGSMGQVAAAGDYATMELFSTLLQKYVTRPSGADNDLAANFTARSSPGSIVLRTDDIQLRWNFELSDFANYHARDLLVSHS